MLTQSPTADRFPLGSLLAFLAAFLLTGGIDAASPPVSFEETSLIIDAKSGRFEFQVELAASPEQRGRGLMFREDLAEDRGMLFDFGKPQQASMWMRNTYVPLDMLFIDDEGRITQIATDTQPLSDAVIASREPVRAVLELRAASPPSSASSRATEWSIRCLPSPRAVPDEADRYGSRHAFAHRKIARLQVIGATLSGR